MLMNTIEQLKVDEGFESRPYFCSAGKSTIGYGRNLEAVPFSNDEIQSLGRTSFDETPLTEDEAEILLVNDVERIHKRIVVFSFWNELSPARQGVILNMCFNLGVKGFLKFTNTIGYLQDHDYEAASREMLDSKWAREDVGEARSQRLSDQMFCGMWQ